MSPTYNDVSAIRFDFVLRRDDGQDVKSTMFAVTNQATLTTFVSNNVRGNYTGELFATDGGTPYPQEALVATVQLEVNNYTLALSERCKSQQDATEGT